MAIKQTRVSSSESSRRFLSNLVTQLSISISVGAVFSLLTAPSPVQLSGTCRRANGCNCSALVKAWKSQHDELKRR